LGRDGNHRGRIDQQDEVIKRVGKVHERNGSGGKDIGPHGISSMVRRQFNP
jgi:hypothetical protein